MSDQDVKLPALISGLKADVESPAPGQSLYDEAILFSGWIYAPGCDSAKCSVRAYLDDLCIAETQIFFCRPDISEKLGLSLRTPTGFRMLGKIQSAATAPREATLRIVALWNGERSSVLAERSVKLVPALLRQRPYGEVVFPENEALLHRENIYGSGPPIEEPGIEFANMLRAYLPAGCSIVDVGCGAGAYGPGLIAAGHSWLGLEANAHCCEILLRRQLTFRRVDPESRALPCADGEWDCAVCLEVVEHIKEPEIFVGEVARVIRGRALFSVPNIEVLPYFHDWGVVPWHLLEGDHKNFFTRGSLRALLQRYFRQIEIFPLGEHPVKTRDGIPLYVHLFAVADK